MLNCQQATEKLSQAQDRPLGTLEHLSLKLHVAMCVHCRRAGQQMALLRRLSQHYAQRKDGPQ